MQPRINPRPIYFIEPPLGHLSGGSMYNLEIVKRLERDAMGTSFWHALQSPVSELVQHVQVWPARCVFVLDGLYLSVPEFKASLPQFLPYAHRAYLMLHYLESMHAYHTAQARAALWAGEQLWLQAVRGIIVPSRQLREYLARQGIDQAKITVASPGIAQVPAVRLSRPRTLSANDPVMLIMVGILSRGKGQLEVVHMLTRMPAAPVRLHLIGDCAQNASYTAQIRALIQRAHLQDAVIMHGSMPQQALFELLPQYDLYLSASSYESYSMATAEAVAHGLPVLAYATGAIGDWIEDGVNGVLIEIGKSEQFFQALRQLLTERDALHQLRHNAWARTASLAFHSWDETYRVFLRALGCTIGPM
jgi:glycosyltransferase involved in cell wall biosynthesis